MTDAVDGNDDGELDEAEQQLLAAELQRLRAARLYTATHTDYDHFDTKEYERWAADRPKGRK